MKRHKKFINKRPDRAEFSEVEWRTRIWIGCFPFRFKGGEAAFCRFVAFVQA